MLTHFKMAATTDAEKVCNKYLSLYDYTTFPKEY